MSASSPKYQYLLPGEHATSSLVVEHHGMCQTVSSTQASENKFLFPFRIYKPKENDYVIGIILVRAPDLFLVDINSTEPAILPMTSFNNGCLPSRQAMNRLSVVYARVVRSDSWAQPELSCQTDDPYKKKSPFGLVEHGYILRCSLVLCKKLQRTQLISQLNSIVKNFQMDVTQNGFVWYITDTMNSMIAIKNVIYKHELENDIGHLIDLYKTLMNRLEGQKDESVKENSTNQ